MAVVEAALLFPLLLLIVLGLIEYGWAFLQAHEVTNAARSGARVGILPSATNSDVSAKVAEMMNNAQLGSSGYSITFAPADVSKVAAGQNVTITVNIPYSKMSLFGVPLAGLESSYGASGTTPSQYSASVTMIKEGP